MPTADPRAALAAELSRADDDVDLARAALLIACEEYPQLDVEALLQQIGGLAQSVRARLSGDEGPASVIAAINTHLYDHLGFRGNQDDYYDPRNSYLNQVLERRTGIPITLAILYREIAKRLGHKLVGLSLPLHFMLAWPLDDGPLIVDAFDGGKLLDTADCARRVSESYGERVELAPSHFAPVSPRAIVRRLLNNLRGIYSQREDYVRALAAIERMQLVLPALEDSRDRGLILFRLGRHAEAEAELTRYVTVAPQASDRPAVEQHLDWARRLRASAN